MSDSPFDQNQPRQISRRRFLGEASCAAVGSTAAFSALLNLQLSARAVAAQVAPPDDYKALVCVFLAGGNDSYNMLVPTDDAAYRAYSIARGNIALQRDGADRFLGPIIDLPTSEPDGRTFGLHPWMPEVRDLFAAGDLGFVANVGTLVEPIANSTDYHSGKFRLPHALYSHNDQIAQWQTAYSEGAIRSGWAGRAQDLLRDTNPNQSISMNISVGGTNMWQTGVNSSFFSINSNGSVTLRGKNAAESTLDRIRYDTVGFDTTDLSTFSGQTYQNMFQQAYLRELQQSTAADRQFADGFGAVDLSTPYDGSSKLARDLRAVARTIGARDTFDMRRQVFFVVVGGWDHHHELVQTHSNMLGDLSRSLSGFQQTLAELGVSDDVVTFTASDFGRTMRTNGRGTDHGWGGHQMVMGGPVKGGQFHGSYPTAEQFKLYGPLDTGNGRLIPTTSVDSYAGELATWFGVPPDLLDVVLPNVNQFFTPSKYARPVGFIEDGFEDFTAGVTTNCVDFDGLITLTLVNTDPDPVTYTMSIDDEVVDITTVAGSGRADVPFGGRQDGAAHIVVRVDDYVVLDTVETFACDPIGPEVDIVTRCSNNESTIDVCLINAAETGATYEIRVDGLSADGITVGPRRKALITFTGWADDRYAIEVLRDGEVIHSTEELVACAIADGEVTILNRCLGGSGRLDAVLTNPGDNPAEYEVRIGAIVRTATVAPGESRSLFATGRRDGDIEVVVLRDGFEIHRSMQLVACNVPEATVVVETSCLGNRGRIDIALLNDRDDLGEYQVMVGHIERMRTIAPGRADRFAVTGRRDGDWVVTVHRNGEPLWQSTETVACAL